MTGLPRALKRDIDQIRSEFESVEAFTDDPGLVVLTLIVRGVDVRAALDLSTFPTKPPSVLTDGSWKHRVLAPDGAVTGLVCLSPWNRTYGVAHVIRELHARFVEEPPVRRL